MMTLAERLETKGRSEGLIKGRLDGFVEGKVEGQAIATREIAVKLLSKGSEPHFVSEITGLPIEMVESLAGDPIQRV